MKITCNGKVVECGANGTVILCPDSIGCSIFGNGDFYDLGFSHSDIRDSDILIEAGDAKIVIESPKTAQDRKVKQFQEEHKVSESAARHFLTKTRWHYGLATTNLKMQREDNALRAKGIEPKPCGEIPLGGPPMYCNLEPSDKVPDLFSSTIRPMFPALMSKPILEKDVADFDQFMPKTAEFQALDRINRTRQEHPIQSTVRQIGVGIVGPGKDVPPEVIVQMTTKMADALVPKEIDYCKCSYPTYDHVSQTSGTCGECGKLVCQAGMETPMIVQGTYTELNPVYAASLRMIEACLCPEALKLYHEGRLCVSNADTLCKWPHEEQMKRLEAALTQEPAVFVPRNVTSKPWRSISEFMNPCADIKSRGLNWACACQDGMVGPMHCREHGTHPSYGQLHPDALRILRGESNGHYCWNYPVHSSQWWEVKPGFEEPRVMVGGKSSA